MKKLMGAWDYRIICIILSVLIPYVVFSSKGHVSTILKPSPGITLEKNGRAFETWGVGYYAEQSKALLKGQFNLLVDPPSELLALSNPYDPVTNAPYRLHDASLFEGKYYLYWSPLPAVIFYIPFHTLFGHYPSDSLANLFFYFLTVVIFGFLLKELVQGVDFQNDQHLSFFLIFFGYAFALNPVFTHQIASPAIYAVAVACSTSLVMLSFFLLLKVFGKEGRGNKWFTLLSLISGLAVAVRPNLGPSYLILFGILSYAIAGNWHIKVRSKSKSLSAIWIPFCVVMAIFMAINYVRFKSLTEFGIKYQLTGFDNPKLKFFDLSPAILREKILFNFKYYFLIQPRSSNAFPFFMAQPASHMPAHMVLDTAGIGLFWAASPIFILGALAFRKIRRFPWHLQNLRPDLIGAVAFVLVNLVILLIMNMASVRYITEVVAVIWILAAHALVSHGVRNGTARHLLFISLLMTTILGFSYGFMGDWLWAAKF